MLGDPRLDRFTVPDATGGECGDRCGKVGVVPGDLTGSLRCHAEQFSDLGHPNDGCSHERKA
jgi:hypothetical protein